MKKDKQKIIGEEISDDRLQELLLREPEKGLNKDYFILMRAYQALRADDFTRFIALYQKAGFDLSAKGPAGLSLEEEIFSHKQGKQYLMALREAAIT